MQVSTSWSENVVSESEGLAFMEVLGGRKSEVRGGIFCGHEPFGKLIALQSESIGIPTHLSLSPLDATALAYLQGFQPRHGEN